MVAFGAGKEITANLLTVQTNDADFELDGRSMRGDRYASIAIGNDQRDHCFTFDR